MGSGRHILGQVRVVNLKSRPITRKDKIIDWAKEMPYNVLTVLANFFRKVSEALVNLSNRV